MANTHNVFVYGTLRPGYGNNHRLLRNAVHIGPACTSPADDFTMYLSHLGGGIPFVVRENYDSLNLPVISGDLYQVNNEELARLDSLEGHPNWYCREEINIRVKTGGKSITATAWIYLMPKSILDSNIVNTTGDFKDIRTFSDNSHITLNITQ